MFGLLSETMMKRSRSESVNTSESSSSSSTSSSSSCAAFDDIREIKKKLRVRLNYLEAHAETMIERQKDARAQCDDDHFKIKEFLKHIDTKFSSMQAKLNERIDKMHTDMNQQSKEHLDEMKTIYLDFEKLMNERMEKMESLECLINSIPALVEVKFKTYMDKIVEKLNKETEKICCRYCWEEFNYLSTIRQCINGHLICQECHDRDATNICGVCQQPRNGRAFCLELHLLHISDAN